jgi:hypothetical protein
MEIWISFLLIILFSGILLSSSNTPWKSVDYSSESIYYSARSPSGCVTMKSD